jgi:hypothetical protein
MSACSETVYSYPSTSTGNSNGTNDVPCLPDPHRSGVMPVPIPVPIPVTVPVPVPVTVPVTVTVPVPVPVCRACACTDCSCNCNATCLACLSDALSKKCLACGYCTGCCSTNLGIDKASLSLTLQIQRGFSEADANWFLTWHCVGLI